MKTIPAPFSDGTWSCPNCGALNAVYLEQCGKCNKEKLKENE
jgi:ribosomal protein L40E